MQNSLIQPKLFALGPLRRRLVLFANLEHLFLFKEVAQGGKIKSFGPAKRFHFERDGQEWSAVGGMIGAPLAMMTLEHCLVHEIEDVIFFGTAGWIGPEAQEPGTLLVPERGLDLTGTCEDYGFDSNSVFANPCQLPSCRGLASRRHVYDLSLEKLKSLQECKIDLIDMEAVPLHNYLRQLGIPSRFFFLVSDQLIEGNQWISHHQSEAHREGLARAMNLILS